MVRPHFHAKIWTAAAPRGHINAEVNQARREFLTMENLGKIASSSAELMDVSTNIEPLILDFLEFLARGERVYDEVMDAWRTSCPRLTVWEDANERRLVTNEWKGPRSVVKPTAAGLALLERYGRLANRS